MRISPYILASFEDELEKIGAMGRALTRRLAPFAEAAAESSSAWKAAANRGKGSTFALKQRNSRNLRATLGGGEHRSVSKAYVKDAPHLQRFAADI